MPYTTCPECGRIAIIEIDEDQCYFCRKEEYEDKHDNDFVLDDDTETFIKNTD